MEKFNSLVPNGYNLMTGGGNGRIHSESTKQKMSETRTGKKHTDITKKRISEAHKGKKISLKTRELLSKSRREILYQNYPEEIKKAMIKLKLDVLPMYIVFGLDKRPTRNIYYFMVKSPNNQNKMFSSKKITLEKRLELAIEYKNTIINGHRS